LCEQLADVVIDGVMWNTRHRLSIALGECDAEQLCALTGVFTKHLVEITQSKEQQGVSRQIAAHLQVLPHHRGQGTLGAFCHRGRTAIKFSKHWRSLATGKHSQAV